MSRFDFDASSLRRLRIVLQLTGVPLLLLSVVLLYQWHETNEQHASQSWGVEEIERRLHHVSSALDLLSRRRGEAISSDIKEQKLLSSIESKATDAVALLLKQEPDLKVVAMLVDEMKGAANLLPVASIAANKEQRALIFHRTNQQVRSVLALFDEGQVTARSGHVQQSQYFGILLNFCVVLALLNGLLLFFLGHKLRETEHYASQEKIKVNKTSKTLAVYSAVLRDEVNTSLMTSLHGMQELRSKLIGPDQLLLLGRLQRATQSALSVVQNILGAGTTDKQVPLLLSRTSIQQCVDTSFRIVKFSAADDVTLHSEIEASVPDYVMSDTLWLTQILLNLLGNSVKFTRQGSIEVHVSVCGSTDVGRQIKFEFNDTGIGISPEKLPRIFDSYQQGDESIQKKFGGTGLGLSVVKKLVDDLKGSIQVSSKLGVGTRFIMLLPLDTGLEVGVSLEDKGDDKIVRSDASQSRLQVLVAEDNAINQLVAQRMLEKLGCSVSVAENGLEALAQATKKKFDLILMDLQMPVMDGVEAAKKILEGAADKTLIIAMTANVLEHEKQRSIDAGMVDFVSKPITLDVLRDCLDRHDLMHSDQQVFDR